MNWKWNMDMVTGHWQITTLKCQWFPSRTLDVASLVAGKFSNAFEMMHTTLQMVGIKMV